MRVVHGEQGRLRLLLQEQCLLRRGRGRRCLLHPLLMVHAGGRSVAGPRRPGGEENTRPLRLASHHQPFLRLRRRRLELKVSQI